MQLKPRALVAELIGTFFLATVVAFIFGLIITALKEKGSED